MSETTLANGVDMNRFTKLGTPKLTADGLPAIALATIESINEIAERLSNIAEWKPTSLNPDELSSARKNTTDLLTILAELKSHANESLRATITYAIDSRLLPQRQIADAAGVALHTAQSWAQKESSL